MTDYSDDEKYQNFKQLLSTIEHIQSKKRITEDWMEEHKKRILMYRDYFGDFNRVNPDCKDRTFRKLASDIELLLNHLVWEVQEEKSFTVDMYLKLNVGFKRLIEIMCDDLSDMFASMSV
jgi:hypothetical protein